ncbi:MAG: glutathione S-transferase family protein [Amylibacter sp.]|nr:glutathione S-transferase family protein [Amylibacter sp.]
MAIDFYYLSGSPFSWRVWLSLEHKQIPYRLHTLSPDAGDLKDPAFTVINPHQKAPAITDNGLMLYESAVIVDYLEEKFTMHGPSLWPEDVAERAFARRVASEANSHLYPPVRRMVVDILFRREGSPNLKRISKAKHEAGQQLALLQKTFKGDYIAGSTLSSADFALYPFVALLKRIDLKNPAYSAFGLVPDKMQTWAKRIEALPFFQKTYPPHWRKQDADRQKET